MSHTQGISVITILPVALRSHLTHWGIEKINCESVCPEHFLNNCLVNVNHKFVQGKAGENLIISLSQFSEWVTGISDGGDI